MSQSQGSKKELELSALVLDPCPKMGSKEIICYETNQLRLLRVNWTDQADDDIHRYDTLQFITDGDDGVQCIVKPGTTPRITSPPANGLVLRPDRSVKIEAYVAFSSDRDHLSHNKSVAVSDQYGYIQLPPDCDKDRQYWEEQTIYKVEIVISQFTDPVQPIFKVVSPLVTKFQRTQAADEMFFSTIRKFENQYAKNFRENHLGSTHAPRGTSLKERKAETRNIKPGARRLTRDEVKQRVDAVVLHLQPQYGGVCGVVSTPLGEADLTTMTITGAEREEDSEAGQAVRVGDWIKVKLEYREKQRHLFASKIMSRERIPLVLRMVNDEFGQIQVLHGPFNKNSLRYDHHEQGIRYYKHPRLGHVEVDATFYNDEASVFDVEYRRVRRPTEQIVGNASIWVYWYISKRLEDVEQPSQQSGPRGQQQVHGCAASSSSSDISPVIREADNMSTRGSSYASVPPASRPDSMMGSIGEGFRQQSGPSGPSGPSRMSSSSYSTITNNEGQKYNGPMYDDTAMVLKRFPTFFVVYLRERNMAAWLPRQICRSSVTLGKCITVEYIPFEHHPGKDFIHWEVTRVVNVIQGRSEVREDGDDALPLFHVDLYDIGTEWNDYREFGGQPIVKSDDCIYATVADRVKTAQGETISANELIRRYQSKKQAKRLCGFMAYKVDVVPQRMLDQEYHGEDEVEAYTFQLIELVGSHEHYTRKQNNLDSTNLGYENRNLQEDDEIARAKLAIREEQERRMNRSSPTGSFATGQSNYDERSRYASGRTSSASYYTSAPNQDPFNTGAPREFNDRGSTSSYQSASAYPQAHPQPQPQHQYRGKTSPPLSHDTEKERMRQMVSDMSFILKSLESVARQTRVLNPEEEHLFAQGSRISKEFVDRGFHKKP